MQKVIIVTLFACLDMYMSNMPNVSVQIAKCICLNFYPFNPNRATPTLPELHNFASDGWNSCVCNSWWNQNQGQMNFMFWNTNFKKIYLPLPSFMNFKRNHPLGRCLLSRAWNPGEFKLFPSWKIQQQTNPGSRGQSLGGWRRPLSWSWARYLSS